MGGGLASIVAQALGLPEWAPRGLRRAAAWFLLLTAAFVPVVFRDGLEIWVNQETTRVMKLMQPFLDDMSTSPASHTPHRLPRGSGGAAPASTP